MRTFLLSEQKSTAFSLSTTNNRPEVLHFPWRRVRELVSCVVTVVRIYAYEEILNCHFHCHCVKMSKMPKLLRKCQSTWNQNCLITLRRLLVLRWTINLCKLIYRIFFFFLVLVSATHAKTYKYVDLVSTLNAKCAGVI